MLNIKINPTWNKTVIAITILLLVGLSSYVINNPKVSAESLAFIYSYFSSTFESIFLYIGFLILVVLLMVAISPAGGFKVKLPNKTTYSFISWGAMLFATGMGAALLYWSTIEWIYYFNNPLEGVARESELNLLNARTYPIFHWAFTGWAIYCLPAVAFAFALTLKPESPLTFSGILLTKKKGPIAVLLDLLFIGAILSGAGVGLGLSFPLISAVFSKVLSVEKNFALDITTLFICLGIFGTSVYLGIEKGIKKLSNLNIILVIIFLTTILFLGPTQYIISNSINTIGNVAVNFLDMSLTSGTKYSLDWTVFYWAWYLALAPVVGTFIINISNNKTIRQIILGTIIIGTVGCILHISILTNLSIFFYENNILNSPEIIANNIMQPESLIIETISSLNYGNILLVMFGIISIIFLCTTYDSSSYILASASMNNSSIESSKNLRIIFAILLVVQPSLIMFLGGTESFKWILVIFSIPLLFINILLLISILYNAYKSIRT